MSSSPTYHLAGHILSLALYPDKKGFVLEKLCNPRLNWLKFISTGSNHLVLPAIYRNLEKAGLLPELPGIITEHLEKIFTLNLERNNSIIAQSEDITGILNRENIKIMFLKGLGNIFDGLYSSPGERMIQDIDILVPLESWEPAVELLKKKGYRSRKPYDPGITPYRKHYPRLFRDDSNASVELHRYPVGKRYEIHFSPEDVLKAKIPAKNYPSAFVMSDQHKIIHNFIHSQLEHQGHFYARIFLRNLYDQLLLSSRIHPRDVFNSWNAYPRKTSGYLEVMRRTFYPENRKEKMPIRKTGFFPYRHELFLRSKLLSTGMQVVVKMYRSYLRKPVMAVTDRELRKTLVRNIFDKSWYRKHLKSYRRYFRA